MSFVTNLRPSAVAVAVFLRGYSGQHARICRLTVRFPDIGKKPVLEKIGFLRYRGESSFVVPHATDEELQLPTGLTIQL